jgi:predicted lipoprotein with Yx(FWY)xxD motif
MKNWMAAAACAAGIALAATACSSGTSSSGTAAPAASSATAQASSPAAAPSSSAAGLTVGLQSVSGIPGKFLVDGQGRTLYLWEADKSGMSACTGACAATWPPVTAAGLPMAGSGVNQSLLGTTKRSDGTEQVTYNAHPLYYFAADTGAGTAKGQGSKEFGAGWYVVAANGSKIDND